MNLAQNTNLVDFEKKLTSVANFFERVLKLSANKAVDASMGIILQIKQSITYTNPRGYFGNNIQLDTFFGAVSAAVLLDLSINPQNKECYFVAFKGKVQLIPSARGLLKLAKKAQTVANIETWVIFNDEQVDYYIDGEKTVFKYRPNYNSPLGRTWKDIKMAVCKITHLNRISTYTVLSYNELEARRRVSPMANSEKATPYTLWPKEMAEVRVIKHALRLLSFSSDLLTRPDAIEDTIYTATDSGINQNPVEYNETNFVNQDQTAQFEAFEIIKKAQQNWELVEFEKDGKTFTKYQCVSMRQELKSLKETNPKLYEAILLQAKNFILNLENNKNNPIGDATK